MSKLRIHGFAISLEGFGADSAVSRGNGQSLSSGRLARVYGFINVDGSQLDAWR